MDKLHGGRTEETTNFKTELDDNSKEIQMVIVDVQMKNSVNEMNTNAQAPNQVLEKVRPHFYDLTQATRSKKRIIYSPERIQYLSETDEESDNKNDPDDIIDTDDNVISISDSTSGSLKFDDAYDIDVNDAVIGTDSTLSPLKFD